MRPQLQFSSSLLGSPFHYLQQLVWLAFGLNWSFDEAQMLLQVVFPLLLT